MVNISRVKKQIVPLLDKLQYKFGQLVIVETGTIRNVADIYKLGDGHSTLHITKWLRESNKEHQFYSVDLNTKVAHDYLTQKELRKYVQLVESDSIRFLKNFSSQIHLAYLDSANNATHIFKEFLVTLDKMNKGGIIVVDDAMPLSKEVVKIHKVLPYLKKHNINHEIVGKMCIIKL